MTVARAIAAYGEIQKIVVADLAARLQRGYGSRDWRLRRLLEVGTARREVARTVARQRARIQREVRVIPERWRTPLLARLTAAEQRTVAAAPAAYRAAIARRTAVVAPHEMPALVDRRGRRWSLGDYAQMAIRTAAMEATLSGQVERMRARGLTLVRVVPEPGECARCRPWAHRILVVDGDGPDSFATARRAGLFHPRCRCRLVEYRGMTVADTLIGTAALDSVPMSAEQGAIRRPPGITDRSTWLKILSAIRSYRGIGFTGTNSFLRRPELFAGETRRFRNRMQERVDRIDAAMRVSRLPEPITVYRGVADQGALAGDIDLAYQSTSTDERVARQFADPGGDRGVVVELLVPAGIGAIRLSGSYDQAEILLDRGLRRRLVGERTVRGQRYITYEVVQS